MVKVRPQSLRATLSSENPDMATERYNPRVAEPKWQQAWAEKKLFEIHKQMTTKQQQTRTAG